MSQELAITSAADTELLAHCGSGNRERALGEILRRYGGLVLGVARRVLGEGSDLEDVFQDTFLVLVQRSSSIRKGESLGHWLYGVALRTALQARSAAGRREAREREGAAMIARRLGDGHPEHDVLPLLDEELSGLPEEFRRPLLLCYFEGKTHLQAARELGKPPGTLSYLLDHARELLGQRLARRGVGVTGAVLGALLAGQASHAAVPGALVAATLKMAQLPAAEAGAFLSGAGTRGLGGLSMGTKGFTVAGAACLLTFAVLLGSGGGVLLGASRSRERADVPNLVSRTEKDSFEGRTGPSAAQAPAAGARAVLTPVELSARLRLFRDRLQRQTDLVNAAAREIEWEDRIRAASDPAAKAQREKRQKREAAEEDLVKLIKGGWREFHSSVLAESDTYVEIIRDARSNDVCPALLVLAQEKDPSDLLIRVFLARGDMSSAMLPTGSGWSSTSNVPPDIADLYERLLMAGNSSLTGAILDLQLLPPDALEPHWRQLLSEKNPAALSSVLEALRRAQTMRIVNLDSDSEEARASDPSLKRQTELLGEVWKKSSDWSVRMDILTCLKGINSPPSKEVFCQGLDELFRTNNPPQGILERLPQLFDGGPLQPPDEDRYAYLLSRALRCRFDDKSDDFETLGERVFNLPLAKAVRLIEDLEREVPGSYREGIRQVLGQIRSGETRSDALAQMWYETGNQRRR